MEDDKVGWLAVVPDGLEELDTASEVMDEDDGAGYLELEKMAKEDDELACVSEVVLLSSLDWLEDAIAKAYRQLRYPLRLSSVTCSDARSLISANGDECGRIT